VGGYQAYDEDVLGRIYSPRILSGLDLCTNCAGDCGHPASLRWANSIIATSCSPPENTPVIRNTLVLESWALPLALSSLYLLLKPVSSAVSKSKGHGQTA
jgi:hypothetical protein